MSRFSIICLTALLFGFFALASFAQETEQEQNKPDKERTEQLIRDLASEDFRVREKATKELQDIGAPAESALKEALKSDDPEVRWRAQTVLRRIESPHEITEGLPSARPQGDETEQSRSKFSPSTRTPFLPDSENPFKHIERLLLKELQEAQEEALRDLPDFSEESRRAMEELQEWLKEKGFAKDEAIDKLLRRPDALRTPQKGQETEGARSRAFFRYRVWKDGKLVTDEMREEFFGASVSGLTLSSVSDTLRYHLGISDEEGLLVESVARTSPFFGKLEKHDIIIGADQSAVNSPQSLRKLLSNKEKTTLTVIRKGKRQQVEVALNEDESGKDNNR